MSSPSKRIDVEKDNTMFGQLSAVEVTPILIVEASYHVEQADGRIIVGHQSVEKLAGGHPERRQDLGIGVEGEVNRVDKEVRIENVLVRLGVAKLS